MAELMERVRIFISSPGDVAAERQRALAVVQQVQAEFDDRLVLEPLLWEHEPLLASADFQSQIRSPADFDLFVNILCGRLGSPLGPQFTRDDGSTYASGTEFEFEAAIVSHRATGRPELLFYRKSLAGSASPTEQQQQVEAFLAKWFHGADGQGAIGEYHRFGTTDEFAALFTAQLRECLERLLPRPNNLPAPISSFVGRAGLIAQVSALLVEERVRLVNLAGPEGVGKSRLALRTCRNLLPDFPQGVFLVDMRGAFGQAAAVAAIATAMDTDLAGDDGCDALVQQLNGRQMLLVLDNLSPADHLPGFVAALLKGCPELSLLVTSVEPLPLSDATVLDVPPLSLPGPEEVSLAEVRKSEAVQLFIERAQSVRDDFSLDADNAGDVVEICRQLAGMPLAIERATSRMRSMNTAKLLRSLGSIKVKDENGQTVYLVPR